MAGLVFLLVCGCWRALFKGTVYTLRLRLPDGRPILFWVLVLVGACQSGTVWAGLCLIHHHQGTARAGGSIVKFFFLFSAGWWLLVHRGSWRHPRIMHTKEIKKGKKGSRKHGACARWRMAACYFFPFLASFFEPLFERLKRPFLGAACSRPVAASSWQSSRFGSRALACSSE